jgi:hypothetical protein
VVTINEFPYKTLIVSDLDQGTVFQTIEIAKDSIDFIISIEDTGYQVITRFAFDPKSNRWIAVHFTDYSM